MNLQESTAIEHLRKIAVHFNADLIENYGAAVLHLNNEHGEGFISSYNIRPGLSVRVYNITFHKDFEILMKMSQDKPIYFSYNLKGHLFHKFLGLDEEYQRIGPKQNLIISSDPSVKGDTIFPAGVKIELSLIILNKNLLEVQNGKPYKRLERNLLDIFKKINTDGPTRYLGAIDPRTAEFAEIIAKNQRTDVMGRLLTEGAVMNMLFYQLADYTKSKKQQKSKHPLITQDVLMKCTQIGEFVQNNRNAKVTIKEISAHFTISPNKLQAGIRHLFGTSVNKYLLKVRLAHAKDLIQTSNKTIGDVSKLCGFNSKSYFSKVFKEAYDFYPSDYQKAFKSENSLFEISYRSTATDKVSQLEIQKIVGQAIKFNAKKNITGCLIYHENSFFQIIEGPKDDVLALYQNIEKDDRHTDIQIMWKGAKYLRNFSMWSMALITASGSLRVTYEDLENDIQLGDIISNLKNSNEVSDAIWRKIRNIIKSSSPLQHNEVA